MTLVAPLKWSYPPNLRVRRSLIVWRTSVSICASGERKKRRSQRHEFSVALLACRSAQEEEVTQVSEARRRGKWTSAMKDRLEDRLHALVCSGRIGLSAARSALSGDWTKAYRAYVTSK